MKTVKMPCRLAIRHEGEWINAYVALDDTMKDARPIGSILHALASQRDDVFQEWRLAMQHGMAFIIEEITGIKPVFGEPEKAPEHERAGHA